MDAMADGHAFVAGKVNVLDAGLAPARDATAGVPPWRGQSGREAEQVKEGRLVDALAPRGDEGRGTLRKASGSRERALIRRYPNGETPP
jgi:hypothetical protein